MIRLLKAEIFKLKKNRTFKVLLIISLLISVLTIITTKVITLDEFKAQYEMAMEQVGSIINLEATSEYKPSANLGVNINFKDVENPTGKEIFLNSFGSGIIEILLVILIGSIVAKEYSEGTIKNTLSYGRREQYYLSKIIIGSVASVFLLFFMIITPSIFGSVVYGWGESFTFKEALWIIKTFLSALIISTTIVSLITLIATILKSNSSTLGIGIPMFAIIPVTFGFIFGKFSWIDNIIKCTTNYNWGLVISLQASEKQFIIGIVISVIIFVLSTLLGCIIFKNQDIK